MLLPFARFGYIVGLQFQNLRSFLDARDEATLRREFEDHRKELESLKQIAEGIHKTVTLAGPLRWFLRGYSKIEVRSSSLTKSIDENIGASKTQHEDCLARCRAGKKEAVLGFMDQLIAFCSVFELRHSSAFVERLKVDVEKDHMEDLDQQIDILKDRLNDELKEVKFLYVLADRGKFYEYGGGQSAGTPSNIDHYRDWTDVISKFPEALDDIEEANKCYALGRYGAAIFHLMRITEAAVLRLGKLVDPTDFKPQFGSVLNKIDRLVQERKWQDWPDAARPYKQFFVDVLPALYAVKTSWRDKVSHFEQHIVPTAAISNPERAWDVYNSTLSLMRLIGDQRP